MKNRYRLFRRQRGACFYAHDSETGKQVSLRTQNRAAAQRLLAAKNAAVEQPQLNLALARAYLTAHDPKMVTRCWQEVMDQYASHGRDSTRDRSARAFKSAAFDALRQRTIVETVADDFLAVMKDGRPSTTHYLRRLQNLALNLGWLAWPVLHKSAWPKISPATKRAITEEEFRKIIANENNEERRQYYRLLWEIGSAQMDAATLTTEQIDWQEMTLNYWRHKLKAESEPCVMSIGPTLAALLRELPNSGPLFPTLVLLGSKERAAEFRRRCRVVGITGITLHSFRYSWAERAAARGYPERFAQAALGHASKAIHRSYARRAKVKCPSLEEFRPGGEKIIAFRVPEASALEALSQTSE
jgi:integrase